MCVLENFILKEKVISPLLFCIRKFLSQKGLKGNILLQNIPSRTTLFQNSSAIILSRTETVSCPQLGYYSEKCSSLPKYSPKVDHWMETIGCSSLLQEDAVTKIPVVQMCPKSNRT